MLLIVPYGIETNRLKRLWGNATSLLIVPYGIETHIRQPNRLARATFNRTLWN